MRPNRIYIACVFNTIITPSRSKSLHTWVGRAGLILGVWGFGWGAWLSWGRPNVDKTFAISITIGGVIQLICEAMGYDAIRKYKAIGEQLKSMPPNTSPDVVAELEAKRKGHLMTHVGYMLGLFVQACSIPAIIRLTDFGGLPLLLLAIGGLNVINHFYTENFFTQIRNKTSTNAPSEVTDASRLVH